MNIFEEIKEEYIERIGEAPNDDRTAKNVEMRAALNNAMAPLCDYKDIASLWKRDRTTIYNSVRCHEAYHMTSEMYRTWYAVASSIVAEKIDRIEPKHVARKPKKKLSKNEQIKSIFNTIKILEGHLERLSDGEVKSTSLHQVREESVGDDDRHMGS